MNKKTIITALLALVALTGWAQSTKTATIKGYSPALKDGTVATSYIDNAPIANDTVVGGHFTLNVPVAELTHSDLMLNGEGCPNTSLSLYLKPDAVIELTGTDCLYPLWKVDSPIAEQQTSNRIIEHNYDAVKEYVLLCIGETTWGKTQHAVLKVLKQTMDLLPSLPVDAASLHELEYVALLKKNYDALDVFPYTQQLKELEAATAARAPKGFEQELAAIHALLYPPHVLQVGEEAVDGELFDLQGNMHHLFEAMVDGRYVMLVFWSFGCGVSLATLPELNEVYLRNKDKLDVIGVNLDKLSTWQKYAQETQIDFKNWNDGKMRRGGIDGHYCDYPATPIFIMVSPQGRVIWKNMGYSIGWFFGMAEALKGPKQDNSSYLWGAVRQTETNAESTKVHFRIYLAKNDCFNIPKESYLEANGKRYKLTAADGVKFDVDNNPEVNTFGIINYTDFTLTFEPFDTIPESFDFKAGEGEGTFVIRNISLQ